jgi:YHS domain-containing protein
MKLNAFHSSRIMKSGFSYILIVFSCSIFSCGQKPKTEAAPVMTKAPEAAKSVYTKEMVDNKKDPSCGMPLTASTIEDTVHYNGKVYGFCSDECKQIFLKDPEALAKNAEMK